MSIADAIRALQRGDVVGFPTDTVYGLAVDPQNEDAVARLFAVKRRPLSKPIALLVGSVEQAEAYADFPIAARVAVRENWPGALTVVAPMVGKLAPGVGDHARMTVGIRFPDHPVAIELLATTGPLAVTSANRSGESPALDKAAAFALLAGKVNVFVDGECPGEKPSTVVDYSVHPPRVIRQGPVWV